VTPSGRQLTFLNPGNNFRWIETKPGFHLQATNVDKSQVNDSNRADIRDRNFTIVYKLNAEYRSLDQTQIIGTNTHVECQSVGTHFCGDGVVEPGIEACDPADTTHAGWGTAGCNTSCQPVTAPTPSCDSLTASPTFGTSPVTTTLTCNGSNLATGSSYTIDCGNGTTGVMSGNNGTCTYINNQPSGSLTFTPKCTINNTITSSACQTNIVANPPPVAGVCNSAVNGQTYPHTTTAYPVAQCTSGTPSVTTFPTPGTTVSWTCSGTNGGATSPLCSASTLPVPVN
jgi:hypothetical protein